MVYAVLGLAKRHLQILVCLHYLKFLYQQMQSTGKHFPIHSLHSVINIHCFVNFRCYKLSNNTPLAQYMIPINHHSGTVMLCAPVLTTCANYSAYTCGKGNSIFTLHDTNKSNTMTTYELFVSLRYLF